MLPLCVVQVDSQLEELQCYGEFPRPWTWVPHALEFFKIIDADASGTIESEELLTYLPGAHRFPQPCMHSMQECADFIFIGCGRYLLEQNQEVKDITDLFKVMDKDNRCAPSNNMQRGQQVCLLFLPRS